MQRKQIILRTVLALAVLVLVNIVAIRIFTRFDLTESRIYTLSDASRNLVKSLDDKFTVKAYFTSELPPPYNNNRRYLQDQLDEYRAYAKGNFQYELVDPSKSEDLEKEAQRYQIPPVQVQVIKSDKLQVEKAYMGLVFLYGDKQEQIPVLQSTGNLEYEISSKIKKMTSTTSRKVGVLTGHGEPGLEQMKRLQEMLQSQYEVTPVSIEGGAAIPPDIAVLLVIAPQTAFKSWEKYIIDQYLMKGGKVAFLLNRVAMTLQSQMGRANDVGLDDMLESYGIRVNADLVRDVRCAPVTVQQQAGMFVMQSQIPFYYLPIIGEFSNASPVVKDLGSIVFHFVSSVDTSLARGKNLALDVLAATSNKAGRQEQVFMINPTMEVTEEMFKESGIPLAVTLEGSFGSAFADRQVETDSTALAIDLSGKVNKSVPTKIAVFGDGDFVQDAFLAGSRDNIILASNLVDWLADDIGLASIRSRETGPKPLDEVEEGTRTFVKYLNLVLPPVIVILFGVMRWRWRVAMRRRLESSGA